MLQSIFIRVIGTRDQNRVNMLEPFQHVIDGWSMLRISHQNILQEIGQVRVVSDLLKHLFRQEDLTGRGDSNIEMNPISMEEEEISS